MADFTAEEITILKALAAKPQKIISDLELDDNINGDEVLVLEDGSATKNISVDDLRDIFTHKGFIDDKLIPLLDKNDKFQKLSNKQKKKKCNQA